MPSISALPRLVLPLPCPPPHARQPPTLPRALGEDVFTRLPRVSALSSPRELLAPPVEPYIDLRGEPVAHFRQQSHWLRAPTLKTVGPRLRAQDTSTVVVVELDNFGDIGSTPLFPAPLSPAAFAVLPLGGLACLWLGAKPALEDVVDGVRNLKVLRAEAGLLRRQIADHEAQLHAGNDGWAESFTLQKRLRGLRTRLALCMREQGNESVDRVIGGGLVAPGALLTAMGTFATPGFIAGAHSATAATMATLLAGFVGNAPVALYGAINACFHTHRAYQAHRRLRILQGHDFNNLWRDEPTDVNALLQNRQRMMRTGAALKAVASLGISAGAMLTAVGPFGYAVLLPFTMLRAATEYFGRQKITYNRRIYDGTLEDFETHALVNDMLYCQRTHALLKNLKEGSRRGFPWGVHAPVPFNLIMHGVAGVRRFSQPDDPSPAANLHAFLLGHAQVQRLRLDRDVSGALRSKLNLRAETHIDDAQPQLGVLDRQLSEAYNRRGRIDDDQRAMRRSTPQDLEDNPEPWIARLLHFFCEAHLWPALAQAIADDERLAPSLQAVLDAEEMDALPGFQANAAAYLRQLPNWLGDAQFVAAFYGLTQKLLFTTVKQTFRDLQRELMDMITTQVTDTRLLVS